jgi:hypothetical protein
MADGEDGMPVNQAGTGVAHHLFDFLPHDGSITVYGTTDAGRFSFLEAASIETFASVTE